MGARFYRALASVLLAPRYEEAISFAGGLDLRDSLFFLGFALAVFPFVAYLILHDAFLEYLKIQFVDTPFLLPKKIPYGLPLASVKGLFAPSGWARFMAGRSLAFYEMAFANSCIFVWTIANYRKRPLHRMIFLISLVAYNAISMKTATRSLSGAQFNVILPIFFITLAMFLETCLEFDTKSAAEKNGALFEKYHISPAELKRFVPALALLVTILTCGPSISFFKHWISQLWGISNNSNLSASIEPAVPRAKGTKLYPMDASDIGNVVEFLKEHTDVNDRIFTFPSEGHINFLADRQSASRFTIAIYSKVRDEYQGA